MKIVCPHCQHVLRPAPAQEEKIRQSLSRLGPGKKLTLKCPGCQGTIRLAGSEPGPSPGQAVPVRPPAPPELDWLTTGRFEGEEKVEDVPMALILSADDRRLGEVAESVKSVGYQVVTAANAEEAREKMRFVRFACVILDTELEGGDLSTSTFHRYMRNMAMERRRYIFYILLGPDFHTLYDLEALAHSANLVVNTADLKHFPVILRKAIPAYEELFGPFLEELSAYGKR